MSAFEALDGSGQVINAYDSKTGIIYDREGYADYKNRSAESRRLLQAMDYRLGNAFNTPLSTSKVEDAKIPEGRSVYEVEGGGGGGAKLKRIMLSNPLPDQFSRPYADDDAQKPKSLRVKGQVTDSAGDYVGYFNEEVYDGDGVDKKLVMVPPQMALEIKVVKGVDYINVANSTSGRSQHTGEPGSAVPPGTYDLGAPDDIDDTIFAGFYRMDFGD